jgi:hypothetical protein
LAKHPVNQMGEEISRQVSPYKDFIALLGVSIGA